LISSNAVYEPLLPPFTTVFATGLTGIEACPPVLPPALPAAI